LKNQEQEDNASNASRLNDQTKQWKHQQKHKQRCNSTDTEFNKEEPHTKGESAKQRCKCGDSHAMANQVDEISPDIHTTEGLPKQLIEANKQRPTELTQSTLKLDEGRNDGNKHGRAKRNYHSFTAIEEWMFCLGFQFLCNGFAANFI